LTFEAAVWYLGSRGILADIQVTPYVDAGDHIRDELRRIWLRIEYEIRSGWSRRSDGAAGDAVDQQASIRPQTVGDLFAAAELAYQGKRVADDQPAIRCLDAFLTHHERVEQRTAKTFESPLAEAPPLLRVRRVFRLTARQWVSLMFALAPEIDPEIVTAYRYLTKDGNCRGLDGRLLAQLVYDAPESRGLLAQDIGAGSPLLQVRLLEVQNPQESLLFRRIRTTARLVQLVDGNDPDLDPEVATFATLRRGAAHGMLPAATVQAATMALQSANVVVAVQGQRGTGKRLLLQLAASQLGFAVLFVDTRRACSEPAAILVRSLIREAALLRAIPVFCDIDDAISQEGDRGDLPELVQLMAKEWDGPMAVTISRERMPRITQRPLVHLLLEAPPLNVRSALWQATVPTLTSADAKSLAERFAIAGGTIVDAAQAAFAAAGSVDAITSELLDKAVAGQLHQRLQRLGKRLTPAHSLKDLVVDDDVRDALTEVLAAVRDRVRVRAEFGLRGANGISVLFSGHPGVGKSMAGTIIANQLGLEIYEIDLSQVVSKWLGETEKNLSEVFDAAEAGHVVLLFNEADTLFGKRTSDVKSSNDRHANMETNYLLQRLERFGGLAILTTNLTSAIDQAFKRRFSYDVFFSFPGPDLRAELWRRTLPTAFCESDIDFDGLADRYELSGGFIKVACERASYVAGANNGKISDAILRQTIERMYRERGKLSAVGPLE
jgi:hypothetical protein